MTRRLAAHEPLCNGVRSLRPQRGFSLIELLIALAIALLLTSALFALLDPASGAFHVLPESADLQQRMRVAADVLSSDVMAAGSGPSIVLGAAASGQLAPAVFPLRIGRRNADPAGTFDPRRIAVWHVSAAAPQATLAAPLPSASGSATIALGPGCAAGDTSCGFRPGMLAAVFGPSGAWDLFSVTAVQGPILALQHNLRDTSTLHPAGESVIAETTMRTYFFRDDRATGLPQLMRYDAAGGGDIPVVDHVAAFSVDYYGEAEPPRLIAGTADEPDRLTYGPPPPPSGVQRSGYPPGENCAFTRTETGTVTSRLAALGTGPVIVPLDRPLLTDGPWCPDADSANRYDADLLRVRSVVMTLAIEAAIAALRGPAGLLFTRSGTARGTRLVPDRRIRLAIAMRAPNANR